DSLFKDIILPGLQTHRFYVLTEWKVSAGNFGKINIHYKVQDIFTGSVHSGYIGDYRVSQGVSTIKQIFEKYIKEPYRVISETSNGIILKRSVPGGYNIVTPTISITPGSSSLPTVQPGGSVVTPSGQIQPGTVEPVTTGNFLTKAALAVAAFLIFR